MKPRRKVENTIRAKLHFPADAAFGDRVFTDMMNAQNQSKETAPIFPKVGLRRTIMHNRTVQFATAAAAVIVVAALAVNLLPRLGAPAYGIDQTIEALQNVRYMHVIKYDRAGNIEDERWEEIDADGYQARYRQNTPSRSFYVVDDRRTVMVYHASPEKNTVVLHDPSEQSYTWHYAPGKMFEEIADGQPKYAVVAENVTYKGRPAHQLRSVAGDTHVYIDSDTKLPMAIGDYEISYEEPPAGTFDIVIPDGAIVVDKRPGAPSGPEPQWMVEERQKREIGDLAQAHFEDARRALAGGDYQRAAGLFEKTIELSDGKRNWAWLWMGKALYAAGDYDGAIYRLTAVIDMLAEIGWDIPSYRYARGLAYAGKGMTDMAALDLKKILPKMIESLRNPEAARSFDLADDPLIAADGMREGCHDAPGPEESTALMIERLRLVTGQNFGYDPGATAQENEAAIAAWEHWLDDDGQISLPPAAELPGAVPTNDSQ
ncbi:MAG: tetratricopeptide repeat protein [Sedimentisphaerales bacterium]|nr:tetratricopeptide repeat protein [Sedimentisphaerales bacterium]